MEVAAGAEGEVPVTGPVGGAKALPVRAGEGQQVRPRPTARGGPAAGPGRRRTGKGQPGVADAASAVPGSGARAWGWDLHLPTRAAPRSPLGGGRAGKGEQTPAPGRGAGSAAAAAATSQPGPRLPLPLAVGPGLYGDRIRSLAPPPPAGWSPRPLPPTAQPPRG